MRVRGINKKNPSQMQLESEFLEACFEGDLEKVKKLLEIKGLNANTRDLNSNTALMQAALKGNLGICKLLITDIDGEEFEEDPSKNEIHCPRLKQTNKLDINAVNCNGKTALHKAAYNGSSAVIKLLLFNGADPEIVDSSGNKPMDYINTQEAKYLMRKWKPEWIDKHRVPKSMKVFENPDTVNFKQMSVKMKKRLKEFLIEKAKGGEYNKIYNFVSQGKATIETKNAEGQSLLSLAVVYGHFDCVYKMLKDLSPNVNSKDSKGWTPLMNAAYNGYLRIAKLLLSHDADINMKNDQNMKAVDLATGEEIKKFLIQETRNAHIFNFEQILELSMTNASTNKRGSNSNSFAITEHEEEGNRALFDKMEKNGKAMKNSRSRRVVNDKSKFGKRKTRMLSQIRSSMSQIRVHKAVTNQRHCNTKSKKSKSLAKILEGQRSSFRRKRKCLSPDITSKNAHFLLLDGSQRTHFHIC